MNVLALFYHIENDTFRFSWKNKSFFPRSLSEKLHKKYYVKGSFYGGLCFNRKMTMALYARMPFVAQWYTQICNCQCEK